MFFMEFTEGSFEVCIILLSQIEKAKVTKFELFAES